MQTDIILYLRIEDKNEEEQAIIIADLEQKIHEQIIDRCFELLSEDKQNQLDQLIDTSSQEEVVNFLRENIESFEELLKSISVSVIDEYKK